MGLFSVSSWTDDHCDDTSIQTVICERESGREKSGPIEEEEEEERGGGNPTTSNGPTYITDCVCVCGELECSRRNTVKLDIPP